MASVPEFIPCGAHYYRPPSPLPTEWEKDLRAMKAKGFNMVEYWAMWRWQNPAEGVYQFTELDRLMDLAAETGLKVNLSLKYDSVPTWIFKKFPEATITTLSGRRIGPQDTPARQIGGVGGACGNHEEASAHKLAFIRATVERFREHPALAVWNSWGEPDLGHSLYRIVGKSEANADWMTCYCPSCQRRFRVWLRAAYADVDTLNQAWSKNYVSWEDVETPVARDTFVPMTDWRNFHIDRVTEVNREMMDTVRAADPGHPVMIHTHSLKYFDLMSTAVDLWRMAEPGDLHGATLTDDPFACDMMRSASKGKRLWSVEIHAVPGMTMVFPYAPSANDIKFFTFIPMAAGFTGFQYWQYRPELLGREAPAWGLTKPDGSETPWLNEVAANFKLLTENQSRILGFRRLPTKTAILWHPDCEIFSWNSYGSEYFYHDSVQGMHHALYEDSQLADFIHPREIMAGGLDAYDVLVAAMPMYLKPELIAALQAWVERGGTLIAESHFGAVSPRDGRWQMTIPGFGAHAWFGCRQDLVRARRDWTEERAEMVLDAPLGEMAGGTRLQGMICEETLLPEGGEVLARFTAGNEPAVTRHAHGKGKVIYIGTMLGHDIWKYRGAAEMRFLQTLVTLAKPQRFPKVFDAKARADVLTDDRGGWLILRNLDKRAAATATVWLPDARLAKGREVFSGETIAFTASEAEGSLARIGLAPGEVKVFDLSA